MLAALRFGGRVTREGWRRPYAQTRYVVSGIRAKVRLLGWVGGRNVGVIAKASNHSRAIFVPNRNILLVVKVTLVRNRPQRSEQLRLDDRPIDIERVVEIHLEGDGPTADQSHLHVAPVSVGRVLHHRPTLKVRLLFLSEHKAVARLPDRRFDDIADLHLTLPFAREVQLNRLLLIVVG